MGEQENPERLEKTKYEYLYNLLNIRIAQEVNHQRNQKIQESTLQDSIKKELKKYADDLDYLLQSIIDMEKIKTDDDFDKTYQAAVLAEIYIQFHMEEFTRKQRKEWNVTKSEFRCWRENLATLGEDSGWLYLLQGRSNIIIGLGVGSIWCISWFYILAMLYTKSFLSGEGVTIVFLALFFAFFFLWPTVISKKVHLDPRRNNLTRIKNKYIHTRRKKIKDPSRLLEAFINRKL